LQVQSPDDARQAETKGETWRRRKKLTDPAIDAWSMSKKTKKKSGKGKKLGTLLCNFDPSKLNWYPYCIAHNGRLLTTAGD